MAQKKTFKAEFSPAMQFISTPTEERGGEPNNAPEGYKLSPRHGETRSKRLQLLIAPSLHEKLKERAAADGCSVNDFINRALTEAVEY